MYLELNIPACDTCHRAEDRVDVFSVGDKTYGVLERQFAFPSVGDWRMMTTEDAAFDLEATIGALCADPVKAIEAFRRVTGRDTYEELLMSLVGFTSMVKRYPQGTITVGAS